MRVSPSHFFLLYQPHSCWNLCFCYMRFWTYLAVRQEIANPTKDQSSICVLCCIFFRKFIPKASKKFGILNPLSCWSHCLKTRYVHLEWFCLKMALADSTGCSVLEASKPQRYAAGSGSLDDIFIFNGRDSSVLFKYGVKSGWIHVIHGNQMWGAKWARPVDQVDLVVVKIHNLHFGLWKSMSQLAGSDISR